MPELPEVEITRQKLSRLKGKIIAGFWNDWPRSLRVAESANAVDRYIRGRKVLRLWRHGKVIFLELSGDRVLGFHQRMSGSLQFVLKPQTYNLKPNKHTHTKVFFADGSQLLFEDPRKFGVVWYGKREQVFKDKYLAALGPDALNLRFEEFVATIKKHKGMIKPLLLRQEVIAGIGNIVADETLWLAKIHPKTKIEKLSKAGVKRIYTGLQKVFKKSMANQGTTLRNWRQPSGQSGRFQEYMRVYGRKGEKCFRCQNKIQRIVTESRGTWLCVKCQRL